MIIEIGNLYLFKCGNPNFKDGEVLVLCQLAGYDFGDRVYWVIKDGQTFAAFEGEFS
jgi:hypothetical protein